MDGLTAIGQRQLLTSGTSTASELKTLQIDNSQISDSGQDNFANTLKKAIDKVDHLQKQADIKMQQLATGKNTDVADVMIAAERADLALKLMVQVRNKIIDAYNEVSKMQV